MISADCDGHDDETRYRLDGGFFGVVLREGDSLGWATLHYPSTVWCRRIAKAVAASPYRGDAHLLDQLVPGRALAADPEAATQPRSAAQVQMGCR